MPVNEKALPAVGIQSVEVAGELFRAMVDASEPSSLTSLAKRAGMPPAKARKYLASLVRVGLAAQEGSGGKYMLGPLALQAGLAAMRQLDLLDVAQKALNELRDELGMTVSLAVWAPGGPALVRWAQAPIMVHSMRLGTVFPLLSSAPGRLFLAYLDHHQTDEMVARELGDGAGQKTPGGIRSIDDVHALVKDVRAGRLVAMQSVVAPRVDVVAAPVFDHTGAIVAAMVVVGVHGEGAVLAAGGQVAQRLLKASEKLSRELGARA